MTETCPDCGSTLMHTAQGLRCAQRGCGAPEKPQEYVRSAPQPEAFPVPTEAGRGPEIAPQTSQEAWEAEQLIAYKARVTADLAADVTYKGLAATRHSLIQGTNSDPIGAAIGASKVLGTMTDKLLLLTGRPNHVTEHRDPEEMLENLARKLGVIDGRGHVVEAQSEGGARELRQLETR